VRKIFASCSFDHDGVVRGKQTVFISVTRQGAQLDKEKQFLPYQFASYDLKSVRTIYAFANALERGLKRKIAKSSGISIFFSLHSIFHCMKL